MGWSKIVEIIESEGFSEFDAVVENVVVEKSKLKDAVNKEQYHITMKPLDKQIKGKSGVMHEWVQISEKSSEEQVQAKSALGQYIAQLIKLHGKQVKALETVTETMAFMKGRKYTFEKKELGSAFMGHPAKSYWFPSRVL
jgi:hypothetical protein